MLIVLEGPDGSGKSTLGKRLELDFDGIYKPSPLLNTQDLFDEITEDQEYYSHNTKLYIMDRVTWISELIYSKILNRPCRLNLMKFKHYLELPQIVIYCRPTGISKKDISTEYKQHKSNEHLEAVKRKHTNIINAYEDFFESNKHYFDGFYQYNWKGENSYKNLKAYLEVKLQCVA
jgi:thymidylate kinase